MKLYEYEAKQIFEKFGLTVPKKIGIIENVSDLETLSLNFPIMIKAMVLIGGRGKAGGIKKVDNVEEARDSCSKMLGLTIHGYAIKKLLLEEAVNIKHEIYLSITTDPATFDLVIVASASGGVDIEEVAINKPEEIWKKTLRDNPKFLSDEIGYEAAKFLVGRNPELISVKESLSAIIIALFSAFQQSEAKICEINPLIVTDNNQLIAADAKFVLDDNSLYRQAPLLKSIGIDPRSKRHDVSEQTKYEAQAYITGFPFLDLLDDPENFQKEQDKLYVGLVPGGAGYGIFSIDEVVNVGNLYFDGKVIPINFMDSGGGPSLSRVADMFHLLMDHPVTDLIITSRFGGISSCDIFIQGLIMALRDRYISKRRMIPVFGRMVGTDLAAARAFLDKAKGESPEPLKDLHIVVGNQKIMADVIKEGIEYGFEIKKQEETGGN
ncbi:MAG: acetate--CoA ligase family protein [Candidatus Heimdallarchaeota archaeon]|nr:acetate--CoA ligase family protein [Candidatus Heimdallarchaeota archaeon]